MSCHSNGETLKKKFIMITRLQESPFLREFGDIVVKKENNIFNNNFFLFNSRLKKFSDHGK